MPDAGRPKCAFCQGTGWSNQTEIYDREIGHTSLKFVPGVVPCKCTRGDERVAAHQKAVAHNQDQMRNWLGDDWRDEFREERQAAIDKLNPVAEPEGMLF